jgi:hypothetical protein
MPRVKLDPLLAEHPGLKPVKWQSVMPPPTEGRAIVLNDVSSAML